MNRESVSMQREVRMGMIWRPPSSFTAMRGLRSSHYIHTEGRTLRLGGAQAKRRGANAEYRLRRGHAAARA